MQELISVIVSIYNIEHYLPRCLETVAEQSYKNLEIILVDDGSTDGSAAICDEFVKHDSRASVIHQANAGLWAARNAGQKVAKGNYLMYVDGDDYLHLDAIRVMYEAINSDGGYDLALVNRKMTERLDEDITALGDNSLSELSQSELVENLFNYKDSTFVYQWNKLYRRELIEGILSNPYMRSQDLDFNFRTYLQVNKAVWVHRTLYFYVQRPTSLVKAPEAWSIYYDCRTRIFYENYMNLPAGKQQYAWLLLRELYRKMPELKIMNEKSPDKERACQMCCDYERATWRVYLKNSQIGLMEKALRLSELHCMWFAKCVLCVKRFLMRLGLIRKY